MGTAVEITGVLQMVAVLLAGYYIQDTIERHHVELEKPSDDPEERRLLEEQKAYEQQAELKAQAFLAVSQLGVMTCGRRYALYLGLFCGEIACLMLVAPMSKLPGNNMACFNKFEITDRPSDVLD